MKSTRKSKMLKFFIGVALGIFIFVGMPTKSVAYTQTAGIVSADAAKVRKEPNTSSDMVTTLQRGSTVMITDEVTDSAGMIWYKITVNGSAGYIRSDLLIKATTSTGNQSGSDSGSTSQETTESNEKPAPTVAKPIAETKAYVNYSSARVREGASTKHEIVGSAAENTPVIITGEIKGNDGKLWYEVKYNNTSGREVTGFIRSDLLTIGEPPVQETPEENTEEGSEENTEAEGEGGEDAEAAEGEGENAETPEVPEEPPVEEPLPEETVKPDYEMVYTQNNEGVEEWYLYDNINGTRQTLAGLMAAAEAGTKQSETNAKQLSTQKIIIIVLAVIVAVLAIAVTLLLFKIKDLYEEDYDDDDDDDDEDEEEDEDEDEDDEEEEVIKVVPKKRSSAGAKRPSGTRSVSERIVQEKAAPVKKVEYDPREEMYEAGAPVAERQQPKRKAKNFLVDDEFEFEFLNMDDKK